MHTQRYTLRLGCLVYSLTLVVSILSTHAHADEPKTYYIAPDGKDNTDAGTSVSAPWQTFSFALPRLNPGDTLLLLDGTYTVATNGPLNIWCNFAGNDVHNGTESQPITVKALMNARRTSKGMATMSSYVYTCSHWIIEGFTGGTVIGKRLDMTGPPLWSM